MSRPVTAPRVGRAAPCDVRTEPRAAHTTASGTTSAADTTDTRPNPPSGQQRAAEHAGQRRAQAHQQVGAALRRRPHLGATDSVTSVEPAIRPQDQPRPSSSSPTPSWTAAPGAAVPASAAAASSSTPPDRDRRPPSGPVGQQADERREEVHAGHVHADDQADDPQRRPRGAAGVAHVHRRHDHDADHDRVGDHDRGQPQPAARRGPDRAGRPPRSPRAAGRPRPPPPSRRASSSGSGRSSISDGRAPPGTNTAADTANAPPSTGQPQRRAEVGARAGQVGPEHRADRRRPDHQRQVAAAALGDGEVRGGVAGLQAAGGRGAEGEQPDEQQRQGGQRRGDHGQHGAEDGDPVAEREPRPPAGAGR